MRTTLFHRFGNGRYTCTGRVIEFEPNRKFAGEGTSGILKGSTEVFVFENIDGKKTRLTYTGYLKLSGFYKLLWPFVVRSTVKRGKAETASKVANVKRILESEAQSLKA
jgi:carbon monoxide dehydrogenase subunit G